MEPNKPKWVFSDPEQDKWLGGPWAIISDTSWYTDNESEIKAWLESSTPGWDIKGTVIEFADRNHLTMFKLRWS